jgi:hypothetical protein
MHYFRRYLTIIAVLIGVAVLLRVLFEIPAWVAAVALLIGWPVIGTFITIDDDLPGGFSNPDGKSVPEWQTLWWWADLVLVRGALVLCIFVVEEALAGTFKALQLVLAIAMMGVGLPAFLQGVRREMAHAV